MLTFGSKEDRFYLKIFRVLIYIIINISLLFLLETLHRQLPHNLLTFPAIDQIFCYDFFIGLEPPLVFFVIVPYIYYLGDVVLKRPDLRAVIYVVVELVYVLNAAGLGLLLLCKLGRFVVEYLR